MSLSFIAVLSVLSFITGSIQVSIIVMITILLVEVFLYALVYYWGLTLNNVVIVNLVIALGLTVDYSVHIAHTYTITKPPLNDYFRGNNSRKRIYKAQTALS